jgi:phosphate transport system protein
MAKSRHTFEAGLNDLHLYLVKMAGMVEESIDKAITALKKQDVVLAKQVIENDEVVDHLEKVIERKCLNLIARQHPLAKDLRAISSALKIITDLERIADHSSDISEITIRLAEAKYAKPLVYIPKMAELAKNMVSKSIDAYVRQDVELALEVCASDDEVDDMFKTVVLDLTASMRSDPDNIDQSTDLLFVAKYLERMGDHATNIGEWVVYKVTGEHADVARGTPDKSKASPFFN